MRNQGNKNSLLNNVVDNIAAQIDCFERVQLKLEALINHININPESLNDDPSVTLVVQSICKHLVAINAFIDAVHFSLNIDVVNNGNS